MNKNKPNTLIGELSTIILMSVVLAFIYNAFSSKGLPLIRKSLQKVSVSDSLLFLPKSSLNVNQSADSAKGNLISKYDLLKSVDNKANQVYKVITLNQLQRLISERRGYLIDARDSASYIKGHIKGAINIPGNEPEKYFEFLSELPRDTLIIIYCNNQDCHLGHDLVEFMKIIEFKNLYLYDKGWDEWEQANMPIEKPTSGTNQ